MAKRWLDLGAGAGFPGLVIAILQDSDVHADVHLVESDQRKCSFLRAAIAATGARAFVYPIRIEKLEAGDIPLVDAVTARALAPFPKLIELSKVWIERGAIGLFPRGKGGEAEFLAYPPQAGFAIERIMSRTDPHGWIFRFRSTVAWPKRSIQRIST
jgi:16S rRNA (guanine527-N7)-methyltransferase